MPRILIYNPTCEMAVAAGGSSYCPPRHLALFEQQMAQLMMYLAEHEDFIVAPPPDEELTSMLQTAGMQLPHFCTVEQAQQLVAQGFELLPWGENRALFNSFGLKNIATRFNDQRRLLHSRRTSVLIEQILQEIDKPDYMSSGFTPELITNSISEEYLNSKLPFALKSLWSSSGRGVQLIRDKSQIPMALRFAQSRLQHDGSVIIEPLLNCLSECSFLFHISPSGEIKYLGCNHFQADEQGRFGKELIGIEPNTDLPQGWQSEAAAVLTKALKKWTETVDYKGYIGFDSMIFASKNHTKDQTKLRLCTEANLRLCMGNINLAVSKLFEPETHASWAIHHFSSAAECFAFCQKQQKENPIVFSASGKIHRGFFRLTSLSPDTQFVAGGVAKVNDNNIATAHQSALQVGHIMTYKRS